MSNPEALKAPLPLRVISLATLMALLTCSTFAVAAPTEPPPCIPNGNGPNSLAEPPPISHNPPSPPSPPQLTTKPDLFIQGAYAGRKGDTYTVQYCVQNRGGVAARAPTVVTIKAGGVTISQNTVRPGLEVASTACFAVFKQKIPKAISTSRNATISIQSSSVVSGGGGVSCVVGFQTQ